MTEFDRKLYEANKWKNKMLPLRVIHHKTETKIAVLPPQNIGSSPVEIRSLVHVEGNKSLPLICSPAESVGPISRLLS